MNSFTIDFLSQLLDVFGHNSEISLVFDCMDTDLEVSIIHVFLKKITENLVFPRSLFETRALF